MKTSRTGEAEETCLGKSPGFKTLILIVRLLYIFNRFLCLLSIKNYSNNYLQNFVMSLEVKKKQGETTFWGSRHSFSSGLIWRCTSGGDVALWLPY